MRHFLFYIIMCLAGVALLGCDSHVKNDGAFEVKVTLRHVHMGCDSATLVVVDDDYNMLRVLGGAKLKDSTFTFTGHTPTARLAYVDFDTDSIPYQFYFILEPTRVKIDIEARQWTINGGKGNHDYQSFLNQHARIRAQRDSLWLKYTSMGTDSTLTWDAERTALHTDSLLQDSLQRITIERINRGDLVSRLIKQRLLPTLTRESLDKIK